MEKFCAWQKSLLHYRLTFPVSASMSWGQKTTVAALAYPTQGVDAQISIFSICSFINQMVDQHQV